MNVGYLITDVKTNQEMKISVSASKLLLIKSLQAVSYLTYGLLVSSIVFIFVLLGVISLESSVLVLIAAYGFSIFISIIGIVTGKCISPIDMIYEYFTTPIIKSMFADRYAAEDLDKETCRELFKLFTYTDTIEIDFIMNKLKSVYNSIKSKQR